MRDFIYPSLQSPPPHLDFTDQFAFQPGSSTTAALIHLLHNITAMLETNPYVIVIAVDFSKAFDSVRHSTLLQKYASLELQDNIYNWIENYFQHRSHSTTFQEQTSNRIEVTASVVQGSSIGPASFVVTAADLHPLSPVNAMTKFADDMYLIVPASNVKSCRLEVDHIEEWAQGNNLVLNRSKSAELVIRTKFRRSVVEPPPPVLGFTRVESLKVLGVTITNRLSLERHITDVLASCSQTMFALRTLRAHGMPPKVVNTVFQASVKAKLCYVGPAWYGYTTAADRERIESFFRRAVRLGYRSVDSPTFDHVISIADDRLFEKVSLQHNHPLHPLLPAERNQQYNLRRRHHNYVLPTKTTVNSPNFITRSLYKNNCYH